MGKQKKISYIKIRNHILSVMTKENITLAEAIVDWADTNSIPIKNIKSYLSESLLKRLKTELEPYRKNPYIKMELF